MSITPGQLLAHYRLVEKIGEGGMGVVWKAVDNTLDREVAIKILPDAFAQDPERLERFKREARAVAALNHANIVTIHSVEEVEGIHFITMELVHGQPLSKRIPDSGLSLTDFLDVAMPLVDAISAAHQKGITHRDLKPDNIMVGDDGSLKVLDFGLAKLRREAPQAGETGPSIQTVTQENLIVGTVPYMAPEQVQGKPVDGRTDIFSMGIIFYEMICGQRPFQGTTSVDLISSILKDTPPAVTEIRTNFPSRAARLVARCLAKNPAERPQMAIELRDELRAIERAEPLLEKEAERSIAVLPFADMSAAKDQDYFCEGMAEEIINALTKIQGLRVTSRTSAFQAKTSSGDIREIGQRLGVRTVLDGSVRKAGDQLRIAAQLIDVAEDRHLWSERYDRKLQDVFAIQDEISQEIVRALQVTLSSSEQRAIQQPRPTDIRAYEFYLRGRKFFHGQRAHDLEFARQMFARAVEIDPTYALAYAGIADCYSYLYSFVDNSEANLEQAHAASRKAIALDSTLSEAYASRALTLTASGQHDEAEDAFETAIRLDSRNFEAFYYYARSRFELGDLDKAARLFRRASEIRPEDYQAAMFAAIVERKLGHEERATAIGLRSLEVADNHLALHPDDVRALYMGGMVLIQMGRLARGLEWTKRALSIDPDSSVTLYNVACNYAVAGNKEDALVYLEKAVASGFDRKKWIENDLTLDGLRDHPRFQDLLDSME